MTKVQFLNTGLPNWPFTSGAYIASRRGRRQRKLTGCRQAISCVKLCCLPTHSDDERTLVNVRSM